LENDVALIVCDRCGGIHCVQCTSGAEGQVLCRTCADRPRGEPRSGTWHEPAAPGAAGQPGVVEPPRIILDSIDEEKQAAEEERDDWVLLDHLEFASIGMLISPGFGGKSTLIAEVIAAIAKGEPLFGLIPLRRCPVLNLDMKNKAKDRIARFRRATGDELGVLESLYFRPRDLDVMAEPLTIRFIERTIEAVKHRTGEDRGLLIIDTLSSAFPAVNQKDDIQMIKLLGELRKAARRHRWAILILHHTTKKGGVVFGSSAILRVLDWLWTLKRDDRTGITTISFRGRSSSARDLELAWDPTLHRPVPVSAIPRPDPELDLLATLPHNPDDA
jgi:hypothetical protein